MSAGRTCNRHGTPQWCPDGVCPYCAPAPPSAERNALPSSERIRSPWQIPSHLGRTYLGIDLARGPDMTFGAPRPPEIVCPHFGLAYESAVWSDSAERPFAKLAVVLGPDDCARCANARIKRLRDELNHLLVACVGLACDKPAAEVRKMALAALNRAQDVLIADLKKWRGPR